VPAHWQPDASLAALKGLQRLAGGHLLQIRDQADWRHLAQATALTRLARVCISSVPEVQAGSTLRLLELDKCSVALGGYDLGRLLLASPRLQRATVDLSGVTAGAAPAAEGDRLPPHPALQELNLSAFEEWGNSSAAAAQFAALAPVLSSVRLLSIHEWPPGSRREPLVLPDLSACTALTSLEWVGKERPGRREVPVAQEAVLCMVAPLKQLQRLEVTNAPRVDAHIALGLQHMLPRLRHIKLQDCGSLLYWPASNAGGRGDDSSESEADDVDEREEQALQQVMQLLRPDLKLVADGYWWD
jgi:hypothetical protein